MSQMGIPLSTAVVDLILLLTNATGPISGQERRAIVPSTDVHVGAPFAPL